MELHRAVQPCPANRDPPTVPTMRRLLVILMLVAVSCGGENTTTEVGSFSEVQASDFVFENDSASPGDAIFRVETTEPMICAIVWGETEALGNFNNSLAMTGTGITQHDVVLPGAEPGATYFFKVQGTTADGTLYASELATFTLPEAEPAAADVDHGENLALRAVIVGVSSEFSDSWVAANAIDGDMGTEWSTSGDGDSGFISIDLGAEADITGVEFITRSMADGSAITDTYWVVIDEGERFGPFPAGTPATPAFQAIEASGRVITFEIESSTGGNTGAVEIEVYGIAGAAAPPSTTSTTTATTTTVPGDTTTTTEDM